MAMVYSRAAATSSACEGVRSSAISRPTDAAWLSDRPAWSIACSHRNHVRPLLDLGAHHLTTTSIGHFTIHASAEVGSPQVSANNEQPVVEIDVSHRNVIFASGPDADDMEDAYSPCFEPLFSSGLSQRSRAE